MDKMMTSNQSSSTAASADQHQNQDQPQHRQDVMGIEAPAKEERKARWRQHQLAGGDGERRPRPQLDEALKCPRCESSNTKFCYYNNYNMLQPRYLCKACRRYWTQGGSLRNIPVGGGSRKNKRSSLSSSMAPPSNSSMHLVPASSTGFPNVLPTFMPTNGFELPYLSLPFAPPLSLPTLAPTPALVPVASTLTMPSSFLDILRGGLLHNQGNNFYGTSGNDNRTEMPPPPSFGFDIMQQHGLMGDHHGGAPTSGATEERKWPTTQHEVNNDDGGAAASEGEQ